MNLFLVPALLLVGAVTSGGIGEKGKAANSGGIQCKTFAEDGSAFEELFSKLEGESGELWERAEKRVNQVREKAGKAKAQKKGQAERKNLLKQRLKRMNQQNKKTSKTWCAGPSFISALDDEEIEESYLGLKFDRENFVDTSIKDTRNKTALKTISKRQAGVGIDNRHYHGPVENQEGCGNCWAFAASHAAAAEIRNWLGVQIDGSEAEISRCTYDNYDGCTGGWPKDAFDFLKDKPFLSESQYPNDWKESTCRNDILNNLNNDNRYIKGWSWVFFHGDHVMDSDVNLQDRVDAMKYQLRSISSLIICMRVHYPGSTFQLFRSGVWDGDDVDCSKVDHAMVVVGWGNDPVAGDYWIVKNSWGTGWGDNGYWRVKAGINLCNIEAMAHYPYVGY